jgi:hypothetical protein
VSFRIARACLLLAVSPLVIASCSDSTGSGPPTGQAQLRAIHATSTLGSIDVLVGGNVVISGLSFGQISSPVSIPGGTQRFVVRSGTTVLRDFQYSTTTANVNNLVVADSGAQFAPVIVPDTGQPAPSKANIRLVNVVGANLTPPTSLQVLIKAPNANPDSVVTSNLDATIAAYWSLMYFDPGTFDIRYVPAGDTTTLAHVTFSVAAGEKKAVVLSREDGGLYNAEVTTEP